MTSKQKLLSAAFGGLLAASFAHAQGNTEGMDAKAMKKEAKMGKMGECHGVNACKAQGECGGKGHECAGKNECKGKGWKKMTKKECKEHHGKFHKMKG